MATRIAVLGGYGNTGRRIAGLLVRRDDVRVTLLGRNVERARELAERLAADAVREIGVARADAADAAGLAAVLADQDLIIVASSSLEHVRAVARAALDSDTDYLDTQLSSPAKHAALREIAPEIVRRERTFITDGGYHPGVPAAMVRLAAARMAGLRSAVVGGKFNVAWSRLAFSPDTKHEFARELNEYDASALIDGTWVTSWNLTRTFDFGPPFGRQRAIAMNMEEMRLLPAAIPSLAETGFYIAGFGFWMDWVIMPLWMVAVRLAARLARPAEGLFLWGLDHLTGGPEGATLVMLAEGDAGKASLRMHHPDPYDLTAIPVVACIAQYLDRRGTAGSGLWLQAHYVEPERFIADLEAMGVDMGTASNSVEKGDSLRLSGTP